ncbi:vesicle coat complex COPI, epsilon subunit [Tribonema minus]|uniref:Coatomer subunit epsilon n=1 Tax=Tribonema minus TaxID=303371 RepID=A0A836CM75_9STRA|nr:vesicle coat complex COPI, epsilon subunit [Tribonema minus]
MSDPDDLFTMRNCFWLGLYQQALAEGAGLPRNMPEPMKLEKEEYVHRCHIAMGQYQTVISAVSDSAPTSLQACKLLATYEAQPENRDMVLLTLGEWLDDPSSGHNPTLQLLAADIYCREDNLKEAIRAIRNGVTMEQTALLAQIYLRMDRLDLALKQHRIMQEADEDSTLTHMVGAWVCLAAGTTKKAQEAAYVFDELIDKYQASPLLLNGVAVAKMHMGEWGEAEANLLEAAGKPGGGGADTLVNLVTCCRHLDKPESQAQQYLEQLKEKYPNHAYTVTLRNAESAFSRVSDSLAVA